MRIGIILTNFSNGKMSCKKDRLLKLMALPYKEEKEGLSSEQQKIFYYYLRILNNFMKLSSSYMQCPLHETPAGRTKGLSAQLFCQLIFG